MCVMRETVAQASGRFRLAPLVSMLKEMTVLERAESICTWRLAGF